MKKNLHSFFIASVLMVAFSIATLPAFAQVKFSAIPSLTTLARDQALQLEFVIEGAEEAEDFSAPGFEGFTIIQGPQYGNYFSSVNGVVSRSVNVTYLLMPQKTGKLVIGPAQIRIKGKSFKSNSINITVLNKLSGNSNPGTTMPVPSLPGHRANRDEEEIKDYILKKGEDPIAKIQKNLIVQSEVSKKSCYEGEPIVATYKLYTRLKSVSRVTKRPSFNGFSVSELTAPESMDFQPDQLNGKPFYSTVIRKVQLFPLQSGEITLEPVEISSQVRFYKAEGNHQKNNNGLDDIFQDFFEDDILTGQTEEHNLTQQTKPITITVKPLPENNKPANFNGAVGKFTVQAALANQSIAASETGTLKIIVQGAGNLTMINAPSISWPDAIEAFEPSAKENIDNSAVPLSGAKIFEYPFTVLKKGNYTIPAVSFSYFNPEKEVYETATTTAVSFAVTTVAEKRKTVFTDYPEEQNETIVTRAERYMNDLVNGEWWWPALVLVLLIWGAYQWTQHRKIARAKNELSRIIKEEKREENTGTAVPLTDGVISTFNTDPLDRARQALKRENTVAFYNELHTALWNYMQQKYQLSPTSMSKKVVADKLKADLFDEQMINGFTQLLDTCELALYTPVHTQAEMYQLLQQAETIIKTVEHKIV